MIRNSIVFFFMLVLLYTLPNRITLAKQVSVRFSGTVRTDTELETGCDELDLYCLILHPTARAGNTTGSVRLLRPPSVFGVSVSRDGRQRYVPEMTVQNLPDPSTFGPYMHYVAWALPPDLSVELNIGTITNGTIQLDEISFNKFLIFVSPEPTGSATTRSGPLVLRGQSPSNRMQSHAAMELTSIGIAVGSITVGDQHNHGPLAGGWPAPPMHKTVPMMPGMTGLVPSTEAWTLKSATDGDLGKWPDSEPSRIVSLADGDTLTLRAGIVKKRIGDRWYAMYAYNGQIPGPTLKVNQSITIVVKFQNDTAFASSVHWHGLRHDNRDDGVPGVTQEAVEPGDSFTYSVRFPDAGLYWYHPHHREDVQQELGLAGNMLVVPDPGPPEDPEAPEHQKALEHPPDHEEILMLDDLLTGAEGITPFGSQVANYVAMGRFGNKLLVNGGEFYEKTILAGETVRFFVTNVSNTRTFNMSVEGHVMKVIATDMSRFENETWEESLSIAPAERYTADIQFNHPGAYAIVNHVQGIDHQLGRFFPELDTLGLITVEAGLAVRDSNYGRDNYQNLQADRKVSAEIDQYRAEFDRPVDREIDLVLETDNLPPVIEQIMRLDRLYFNPVEWSGTMPMMNWATTENELKWILRDTESGLENTEIAWRSKVNTIEKIKLNNRTDGIHAMQHPIHLHGQRFLVLSYNGQPIKNMAWKDTILIPTGMTAVILVEYTNPGKWMMHCHIAEHLEAGMKLVFEVYE